MRRHSTSRIRRAGLLVVAAALALAACGGDDDDAGGNAPTPTAAATGGAASSGPASGATVAETGEPTSGGTLRVAVAVDPSSLDPQQGPSGSDHVTLYPMYDTLVSFDPATLEPAPGIAESWTFSDPTTLVLTLRDGVTFHDGTPVDADAVKASLDRFKEVGAHADLDNVEAVEATGPSEVTLRLTQPDSSLLLVLADRAGMLVGPTATSDPDGFAQQPVGTGPFRFAAYRTGDRLTYERYDDYYLDGEPKLDGIEMVIINDRKAAANALISGQVDFADGLDPADIDQLESSGLHVQQDVGMWFDMMYLNMGQEPLDDPRVRQAINMAVDRDELIAGVVEGYGEPAWMPVPETHWAYDPEMANAWPHDVEAAKRLMEEAGYGDGVTISVVTGPAAPEARRNEILKAQLAEIGIDLQINTMDVNQGVQQYFEGQAYQTGQWAWSGRPDPGQTYYRLFAKDSYQNPGKVEIEGLEALLDEAVATDDLAERAATYAAANELVKEAAPYVPLYFRQNVTAFSDAVQGYTPSLLGKPKVANLWLSE
jgi:ABC-type transport system substrate-binding protein